MYKEIKSGKRYGKFTTIKKAKYFNKNGKPEEGWKCIDDSGKIKYQRNYQLLSYNIMKVPVRAGKKYGEFTTIELVRMKAKKGIRIYKWKCKDRNDNIVYHSIYFLATYKHRRKIHQIEIGKRYGEFIPIEKVKYITRNGKKVKWWRCVDINGKTKYYPSGVLIKKEKHPSSKKTHIIEKGKQYGEFIVIKKIYNYITKTGKKEWRWMCKDSNGKIKYCKPQFLTSRKPQEEQREYEKINKINVEKLVRENKHQMGARNGLYREYIRNSKIREISFRLSFKQFNSLIIRDCDYCGAEPSISNRSRKCEHKGQPLLKHNGIDRVTSTKGYSIKNTVPCCAKCNLMKHIFEIDVFLAHIKKIYEFNIKKKKLKNRL